MISILESNTDVLGIKKDYVDFVGERVRNVITFYLEVFKYFKLLESKKRTKNSTVNEGIMDIKKKHALNDYKTLLQILVKKGEKAIRNENTLYLVKYSNRRIKVANDLDANVSLLNDLLLDYKGILEIEFESDLTGTRIRYDLLQNKYKPINFLVHKIFDYDEWYSNLKSDVKWGPYQLTKRLNINSCPYCNRQYTFTVTNSVGRKIAKPELDHFLPKSKHPLLALSFYNLIPSCHTCNSTGIKGSKPIDYEKHLNPYEKNDRHSLIRFTYKPLSYRAAVGLSEELTIYATYNGDPSNALLRSKVEGNIDLFCLNELYENHRDTVREIIRKRHISGDKYIEILRKTFKKLPINRDEAYRLAYGNYSDEREFQKRTLSKLTKDIAIELRVLTKFK